MPEPDGTITNTPTSSTRTSSRKQGKRLTDEERELAQDVFLAAYELNGNIMLSCKQANIDRSTFYQWCEHGDDFSVAWHQSEKNFADLALAEFISRAVQGYEKPVISLGRIVYEETPILNKSGTPRLNSKGHPMAKRGKPMTERVVSDTLLAMLIKRHFPEYREKSAVVNITTTPKEYVNLPDDDGSVDP